MEFCVYSEQFDAIAADGTGLVIYFDYANGCSCEIPERIVSDIMSL